MTLAHPSPPRRTRHPAAMNDNRQRPQRPPLPLRHPLRAAAFAIVLSGCATTLAGQSQPARPEGDIRRVLAKSYDSPLISSRRILKRRRIRRAQGQCDRVEHERIVRWSRWVGPVVRRRRMGRSESRSVGPGGGVRRAESGGQRDSRSALFREGFPQSPSGLRGAVLRCW